MTVDEYLAFEECGKMQHKGVDGESLGHGRRWRKFGTWQGLALSTIAELPGNPFAASLKTSLQHRYSRCLQHSGQPDQGQTDQASRIITFQPLEQRDP